jgi:GDP-mannose transporter
MVYYNNLLSVILLLPFCIFRGEFNAFFDPDFSSSKFWIINTLAGFFGFYLNFASLWCISSTSATTYAIIGSLNKIPITGFGFIFFDAKMTQEGIYFVIMATLGGFLYAYSKLPKLYVTPR